MDTLPRDVTLDPIGQLFMGGFAQVRHTTESRSNRSSSVMRVIHKQPNICERCRLNDDPSKVPVHPHCDCNVVTEEVETGIANGDNPLFRALRTEAEDILMVGDATMPDVLQMDASTSAQLDMENVRFGDIARWLEQMQPYIDTGAQYVSIVVDDDTQEALQETQEVLEEVASGSEELVDAIKSRKLWLAMAKAVVL